MRRHWKYHLAEATQAHLPSSGFWGMVVLAILGTDRGCRPRLGQRATIDAAGQMFADFMDANGIIARRVPLGITVLGYRDMLRQICDALDFSDEERLELFKEARAWAAKDERVADVQKESLGL